MASILDSAVLVGKESTYGTAVASEIAVEAQADTFKRSVEYLESVGLRGGFHTNRSSRRKVINMGGEGTIGVEFLTEGMAYLLQATVGSATEAQVLTTTAYDYTFATSDEETGDSYTIDVHRVNAPETDGGALSEQVFRYTGCTITGWSITQNVNELATMEFTFDAQDSANTGLSPAATAAASIPALYPDGTPYDWTQATVTWGGSPIHVHEFNLTGDLGLKTDRRFLRGNELKKQPIRQQLPVYEGSMTAEFTDMDAYNDFVAGTERELVIAWNGGADTIESGYDYEFTITMPVAQFSGDTPEVSLGDVPMQSLPFKVLHNGTDDAVEMVYRTTEDTIWD